MHAHSARIFECWLVLMRNHPLRDWYHSKRLFFPFLHSLIKSEFLFKNWLNFSPQTKSHRSTSYRGFLCEFISTWTEPVTTSKKKNKTKIPKKRNEKKDQQHSAHAADKIIIEYRNYKAVARVAPNARSTSGDQVSSSRMLITVRMPSIAKIIIVPERKSA